VKIIPFLSLIRFYKPVGTLLLLLPCLFSLALIKRVAFFDDAYLIFLLTLGSFLMRSAGCIINDLFDHKFDAKVKRTLKRPIASSLISKKSAIIFLFFLLFAALLVLLQFNNLVIASGFFIMFFVITYPLMKRITYYPQFFLGITINFGVIMVSLEILEMATSSIIWLYFSCIIWSMIYDTIYAFQDVSDDLVIGVKSMAIKIKHNPKFYIFLLTASMFLTLLLVGFLESLSLFYFILLIINFLLFLIKIKNCNFENPQNCIKLFNFSVIFGFILLLSFILS